MGRILTIASNSFHETLRQPVFIIILGVAAFLITLSPSFATFALMNDIKLVKDMGLATILIAGFLQSMFSGVHLLWCEIEEKTVSVVLTKPVSKGVFITGKYIGVAVALSVSTFLLCLILLLTVRVGVPEAAYIKLNTPVIFGEIFAFSLAVILGIFSNYFYERPFSSSCFGYAVASFGLAFVILGFFDKDLKFQSFCADLDTGLIGASYLVLVGILTFSAVAIAVSARFGMVLSISICSIVFMLGLLSDHIFGRFAETSLAARAAYTIVPNMQVFWVADAAAAGSAVPGAYLLSATRYGLFYQIALLILSVLLFESREIAA